MVKTRILVVEDEGIVGLEISNQLKSMGYGVLDVVATGEDALARSAHTRPDLVLMDIRLKGQLDGVETAEQIHKVHHIPVVFLTAFADENTLNRARISEPYGYILKPFDERELRIAIEIALYKHRMESTLLHQKRWLAIILNSISDAIIATDERGLVTLLNPVAEALTGWSHDQASGRPVAEVLMLVEETTHMPLDDLVSQVLRQGRLNSSAPDPLLITRTGREMPIQFRAATLSEQNGTVQGVVLILRDTTRQRQIEQELLRAHKLESLGLLAGGVAHDFNNLLAAIINNIGLMKMRAKPADDVYKRLELVEQAAWRGTELTQQLLTFARGGAPIKKTTLLRTILQEAADSVLNNSSVKRIEQIDDDLWPVEIDAGQINQAFQNLFTNAKEAMPNEGPLLLRAKNVEITVSDTPHLKPGKYNKITIQDQGVGIPADKLTRIFDPYFSTKPRNSGLGLTTAYSIIIRHEGYITVESELKVGTTITIYLPASTHPLPAPPPPPPEQARNNMDKGRVLLMDDEELIREATGALLEFLGYEVQAAQDGAEAIALYHAAQTADQPFNIVILDLTVPGGMGGQETIKHLLTIDPNVKAVVSSGYFHDPVIANHRSYGFSAVVSKPYTIEELDETLSRLI